MKKKHKEKFKKGIYILTLIIFTAVSVLPAASIFTNNNTKSGVSLDEESIKEMFGENATYDAKTGTITRTDKEEQNNK